MKLHSALNLHTSTHSKSLAEDNTASFSPSLVVISKSFLFLSVHGMQKCKMIQEKTPLLTFTRKRSDPSDIHRLTES